MASSTPDWTDIGGLIVQGLTLVAVVWYAFLTKSLATGTQRLATEATRQSEHSLIPCLVLKTAPHLSNLDGLEELIASSGKMDPEIWVVNVGAGVALNGLLEVTDADGRILLSEAIHAVAVGQSVGIPWVSPSGFPGVTKFSLGYESLTGSAHHSDCLVESGVIGRLIVGQKHSTL